MNLVTGATGILGRRLLIDLISKGQKVKALKRSSSNLEEVFTTFVDENCEELFYKIDWVEVDFDNDASIDAILKDVKYIYHCMSKVSLSPIDSEDVYKTIIYNTFQFINRVKYAKITKFCFFSSISNLKTPNENDEITEESRVIDDKNLIPYAEAKNKVEKVLNNMAEKHFPSIIIHPGFIIGSGNWNQSSGIMFSWFENTKYLIKNTKCPYVDVRDLSKYSIQLMESDIVNEHFIISAETIDNVILERIVKKELGKKRAFVFSSIFVKSLMIIHRFFSYKIHSFRFINFESLKLLLSNAKYSNKKIQKTLNATFIPLDESIKYHLKNYIKYKNNASKL